MMIFSLLASITGKEIQNFNMKILFCTRAACPYQYWQNARLQDTFCADVFVMYTHTCLHSLHKGCFIRCVQMCSSCIHILAYIHFIKGVSSESIHIIAYILFIKGFSSEYSYFMKCNLSWLNILDTQTTLIWFSFDFDFIWVTHYKRPRGGKKFGFNETSFVNHCQISEQYIEGNLKIRDRINTEVLAPGWLDWETS